MSTDKKRERFDALRAAYIKKRQRSDEIESELRRKYVSHDPQAIPFSHIPTRTEQKRRESARDAVDKTTDKFLEYLDQISPRNWREGVPAHWVYEDLTYEDAVRPLDEKLSVVPPLAYGCTMHKR